jgi:ribosomal protein S18 acetylase RimI-like enzyme
MGTSAEITIRREIEPADERRILELHRGVYLPEFGMGEGFVEGVRQTLAAAFGCGWPAGAGAGWLVGEGDQLSGSLGLTDEGSGLGTIRWFVLAAELRGRGLGRRMVDELMASARAAGLRRLQLDTFSELTAAARLYRGHGFRVTRDQQRGDWGRTIVYQHYELEL